MKSKTTLALALLFGALFQNAHAADKSPQHESFDYRLTLRTANDARIFSGTTLLGQETTSTSISTRSEVVEVSTTPDGDSVKTADLKSGFTSSVEVLNEARPNNYNVVIKYTYLDEGREYKSSSKVQMVLDKPLDLAGPRDVEGQLVVTRHQDHEAILNH